MSHNVSLTLHRSNTGPNSCSFVVCPFYKDLEWWMSLNDGIMSGRAIERNGYRHYRRLRSGVLMAVCAVIVAMLLEGIVSQYKSLAGVDADKGVARQVLPTGDTFQ